MKDESAFLSALRANPADDVTRLVYADWLEERGDPSDLCSLRTGRAGCTKAQLIRLDCLLAGLSEDDEPYARHRARLQELARDIDPGWLALVVRLPIENCRVRFDFECPLKWERLRPTDDPNKRYCTECRRHVFYCDSVREARRRALRGQCVAVDCRLDRAPNDLARKRRRRPRPGGHFVPPYGRRMGRVRVDAFRRRNVSRSSAQAEG